MKLSDTKTLGATSVAVSNDDDNKFAHRESQALKIIDVAKNHYEFVKSAQGCFREGKVFAISKQDPTAPIETDIDDSTAAIPVDSSAFSDLLTAYCVMDSNLAPSPQDLKTAIATLMARAHIRGDQGLPEEHIHLCTATSDEQGLGMYMDHSGQVIHLDARDGEGAYTLYDGDWHYGMDSTFFYRPDEFQPLIKPIESNPNGSGYQEYHDLKGLDLFRRLFPQVASKDWPLIFGYIITPWIYETSEGFPIMLIEGTQGSGKSTLAKKILSLLSREKDPGNSLPSDGRDVAVTAMHHRAFFYDNIDPLNRKQSNLLCRISTGDSISMRKLYSNLDSVSVKINAPILITSIDMGTEQQDFLDRSIIIRLDWGNDRRDGLIDEKFKKAAPHIMGSLLTLAAKVWQILQQEAIENVELGRLADYSKILHAIDLATKADSDIKPTNGLKTYLEQCNSALIESASDDPVFMAFMDLKGKGVFPFNGKVHDLYKQGTPFYEAVKNAYINDGCSREPPSGSMGCSRDLVRLVPALKAQGWDVKRRYASGSRDHGISIWHIQEASTPTLPLNNPDDPSF